MATSSPDRFELYEMMREAFGEPLAAAFIGRIPSMDTSDIATKQNVDNMAIQLRGEMAGLRSELHGDMADLRSELHGEMVNLRSELHGEMTELRGEMGDLRGAMLGQFSELRAEFRSSSRHTLVTIIAAAVSIWLSFYLPNVL